MSKKHRDQMIRDLEEIFQKSMEAGKLNVALKAKEIMGKMNGIISSASNGIKPLAQWSEEEIHFFIKELEEENG